MKDLIIQKPDIHGIIRQVEFKELTEQQDKIPCLRLYATMTNTAFNLQIRATAPLGDRHISKAKPRHLIATIGLSWDDLVQIAEYVRTIQAEKVAEHYDELRSEEPV